MKLFAEICLYAVFAGVIGVLSAWPRYELLSGDRAMISLTFSHAAERIGVCQQLSQEDLNKLAPNMRKPADCPRERHPVHIVLRSGNDTLHSETLLPSGIWSDGKANIYRRLEVPSGKHELVVGMNDSGGGDKLDYSTSVTVDLAPGRNLVIQFNDETQQFIIR